MMNDVRELYQELLLDHARNPRNNHFPVPANRRAEGYNPLCGDRIAIQARERDGRIEDIGFEGSGCAICVAAASTMTEVVKGKPSAEVEALFAGFRSLITGGPTVRELPNKLSAFATVSHFPMRAKCATLAWHTLLSALRGEPAATSE